MRRSTIGVMALIAGLSAGGAALAGCGPTSGSVRILSNDFLALHAVGARAKECEGDGVTVTLNQTTEHKNIQVPALSKSPAEYTVAVIANNSIMPLLSGGLARPLDDLVAKYGQDLQENQLIRIDGQIMAIAFMANSQHLYYRPSVLETNGLKAPASYEEMIENARVLREKGVMANPLAANLKPGWDLAQEFVNMYTGFGGEFFKPGTAEPAINNEQGIAALNMLKDLSTYMSPEFVTFDTNAVKPLWEGSQVAMMNGWGSRTRDFLDPGQGFPEIAADTAFAAAPTVGGGSIPATTLWWDGFVISKNVSDEDADASFQAMMHAIAPALLDDPTNLSAAVWLIKGYQPTPAAAGVFANVQAQAKPYPMFPYMGLLHTALGDNLAEFMQGQESAEQALSDVTAAYTTAAKEAGFLN